MTQKSNPQLKLIVKRSLGQGLFEMNGVKIAYQDKTFIVNVNIYKFLNGFIKFLTN